MKILQIIQKKQLRGAEVFASQLSQHLEARGHEVMMVALADGVASLPFDGGIRVLGASLGKRFWDLKAWRSLARMVRKFAPDIVQCNAADTLKYAVFSKLLCRWQAVLVYRNASTMSRYVDGGMKKKINRFLLKKTNHIISVCRYVQQDLLNLFHMPDANSCVIPVGMEAKLLRKIDLPGGTGPRLVHVGGLSFEKNHEGLFRILKYFLYYHPNARLWVIGSGPDSYKIKRLAASMFTGSQVQFVEATAEAIHYIHSADMLLLPSLIEGLPAVILEAFYANTPVVAYNVGGIGEILDEHTGWLVEKGDEQGFVNAMLEVLNGGAEVVAPRVEAAYALVQEHYRNEEIAKRFEEVYEALLRKG